MSYELLRYGTVNFEPHFVLERGEHLAIKGLLKTWVSDGDVHVEAVGRYPNFSTNMMENSVGTDAEDFLFEAATTEIETHGFANPTGLTTIDDVLELAEYERALCKKEHVNRLGFNFRMDGFIDEPMSPMLTRLMLDTTERWILKGDYESAASLLETISRLSESLLYDDEIIERHAALRDDLLMSRALKSE